MTSDAGQVGGGADCDDAGAKRTMALRRAASRALNGFMTCPEDLLLSLPSLRAYAGEAGLAACYAGFLESQTKPIIGARRQSSLLACRTQGSNLPANRGVRIASRGEAHVVRARR